MSAETLYSARVPYPDVIERGRQQVVSLEVYRDGSLVAPTEAGSTLTIYTPSGTKLVDAAAVTVTASIARYTIAAATVPTTLDTGEGYLQVWSLVMPGGEVRAFHREMAIAVRRLSPSVSVEDLEAEYPTIGAQFYGTSATLQGFVDEAWGRVGRKLISRGILTYQIVSTESTVEAHREGALWLALKFLHFAQGGSTSSRWEALSDKHAAAYVAALGSINFTQDQDGDGLADSSSRKSAAAVVHVNAAPRSRLGHDPRW